MKREIYMAIMVAMTIGMAAGATTAYADDKEVTYGRELMSETERSEQRQKMRSMDEEERQ